MTSLAPAVKRHVLIFAAAKLTVPPMLHLLFPLPWPELITFALAGLALNIAPGADVFFATACGIRSGPRAGVAAGIGTGLGSVVNVSLAALGLAALVQAHPASLSLLRYVGAGYLLYIAWKSWTADPQGTTASAPTAASALRGAFWINLANPKTVLFIFAFLTQFADPALGPVGWQILGLGLIFTTTGTLVTAGYGALAGLAGQKLAPRMGVLNKVAALVFAGLADKLIFLE
jgi:threonine/homoserine/homoserine lactone efflux protein